MLLFQFVFAVFFLFPLCLFLNAMPVRYWIFLPVLHRERCFFVLILRVDCKVIYIYIYTRWWLQKKCSPLFWEMIHFD